jgi:hypothetical protein
MQHENDCLKRRNAQLQIDITSLGGQVLRTRLELERLSGRDLGPTPEPPWGRRS